MASYPRLLVCKVGIDTLYNNRALFAEYVDLYPSAAARWRDLSAPPLQTPAELFPAAEGALAPAIAADTAFDAAANAAAALVPMDADDH